MTDPPGSRLDRAGCRAAPRTCAALGAMAAPLAPRPGAAEVGVRLLKLAAGAKLRPHVGPGASRATEWLLFVVHSMVP